MASRGEIIRAEIDGIVRELNLLANVEGDLNPQQARLFIVLQARETRLGAELAAEIAAQGDSSHFVGCFFLTPIIHQFTFCVEIFGNTSHHLILSVNVFP